MIERSQCKSCIYRNKLDQYDICGYVLLNDHKATALKIGRHGTIIDSRGQDPDDCKLYIKGKAKKRSKVAVTVPKKKKNV